MPVFGMGHPNTEIEMAVVGMLSWEFSTYLKITVFLILRINFLNPFNLACLDREIQTRKLFRNCSLMLVHKWENKEVFFNLAYIPTSKCLVQSIVCWKENGEGPSFGEGQRQICMMFDDGLDIS